MTTPAGPDATVITIAIIGLTVIGAMIGIARLYVAIRIADALERIADK